MWARLRKQLAQQACKLCSLFCCKGAQQRSRATCNSAPLEFAGWAGIWDPNFSQSPRLPPHHPRRLHCCSNALELAGALQGRVDALRRQVIDAAEAQEAAATVRQHAEAQQSEVRKDGNRLLGQAATECAAAVRTTSMGFVSCLFQPRVLVHGWCSGSLRLAASPPSGMSLPTH